MKSVSLIISIFILTTSYAQPSKDTLQLTDAQNRIVWNKRLGLNVSLANGVKDSTLYINDSVVPVSKIGENRFILDYLKAQYNETPIKVIDSAMRLVVIYTSNGEGLVNEYVTYHTTGQIAITGRYCSSKPGVRCSTWTFYKADGQVRKKKNYFRKCT
jgi:hypothetical protein